MPLRWTSCLFRPTRGSTSSLEVNPAVCPAELHDQLSIRGTSCLRPRGAHILYERVDDAGQGAFTPPVLIYVKRLPLSCGLEVCIKRTLITHFVGRAVREARLQVQLNHPHLLPALACDRGRHHYYLVLPAAESDLWAEVEALRQHGSGYSEDELRAVARQVLLGLDYLHAAQLAHRDIKPANILRLHDGRVVVADFGCADGCTAGFVAAGTTQFQPPECRRNANAQLAVLPKSYDQRSQDMWSLGATLASIWFARMPEVTRGGGGGGGGVSRNNSRGALRSAAGSAAADSSRRRSGNNIPVPSSLPPAPLPPPPAAATVATTVAADGSAAPVAGALPPRPPVSAAAAAAGGSAGSTDAPAAVASAPIPRTLAVAGFASCPSTRGACGAAMSAELLDLLAGLLQPRAADRLTAAQALQHPWVAAAAGAADGGSGGKTADIAEAAQEAAGDAAADGVTTLAAATSSPASASDSSSASSSPLRRMRGNGEVSYGPYKSLQYLLGHRCSAPGDQPPAAEPLGLEGRPPPSSARDPRPPQGVYRGTPRAGGEGGDDGEATAERRTPRVLERCASRDSSISDMPAVVRNPLSSSISSYDGPSSSGAVNGGAIPVQNRAGAAAASGSDGSTASGGARQPQSSWLRPNLPLPLSKASADRRPVLRVFVGAGSEASGSS